jgi:hypothetical protein
VGTVSSRAAKRPLRAWVPAAPATVVSVPVHFPSAMPERLGARGVTDAEGVHLASVASRLTGKELGALVAHETSHAMQRTRGRRSADCWLVEEEAHAMTPAVQAGRPVLANYRPRGSDALTNTPADRAAAEAAKRRLLLLRKFVDQWAAREARRLHTATERDPLLEQRRKMDVESTALEPPGLRAAEEERKLSALNRRPLTIDMIDMTEDAVTFRVRFHVRFEDAAMKARAGDLETSVREGIRLVRTQRLTGAALGGKRFTIEPALTEVGMGEPRDPNFWLITVRPSDHDVATYAGHTLEKTTPGVPTSVTEPLCDSGVMSIPPAHVARPDVLGHELLHLFGFVDRYMSMTSFPPEKGKKAAKGAPALPVLTLVPTRPTGGRRDPLGGESGTVLREDLGFLFDRLGVYAMEESRGLDELRKLEDAGMGIGAVLAEIERLEEIVRAGHDPRSLIWIRKDFRREVLKSVEDL